VESVEPHGFTIATVPERFARLGDLHAGIDDVAFSLEPLLEWAARDGLDEAAK
jgi:DNA primase